MQDQSAQEGKADAGVIQGSLTVSYGTTVNGTSLETVLLLGH